MKKLKKIVFLGTGIILFLGFLLEAKEARLDKGEKRFRQIKSYTLKDFHFNWPVTYLDIVNFQTEASDGKHFSLPKKVTFFTRLKVGKAEKFTYKKQLWLAKAILKPDYFWKQPMHPYSAYGVTSMRFLEKEDRRFKAITELQDIKDMFGTIDTEAELRLWIMAADQYAIGTYSYQKIAQGYRVRFRASGLDCSYREYFNYYDSQGKLFKIQKLQSYRIKDCAEILL